MPKITPSTVQKGDSHGAPINEEFMLTVDLGYLSPISDTPISSPESTPYPMAKLHEETPSAIVQDSLKTLLQPEGHAPRQPLRGVFQESEDCEITNQQGKQADDQAFKK